ncbi:putative phosphosugar-binding protein [Herbihabitans rhizosphaerae]|uniref:Putative phosphosugar-binding protein n=1 Tax=Herbihabitans rhizosphaerae TaxID=1872711 RepID=A0A4Q7KXQ3_9PSEU|nr:SIS domain-containing protein [Herbihabitans rhizosphaerae]RZS41110.1 putative phosphosugar-binding protein [Herbihabitans rhizosphaerae]
MTISGQQCAAAALDVLNRVAASEGPRVAAAADLIAACLRADGVVQSFGTGHSQATALEVAGRAGGLIPTNRLSLIDPVLYGGADPDTIADPLLERRPEVARRIYDLAAPRPQDLFVIVSNSGVNAGVVEMASLVKSLGHKLIAITSVEYSGRIEPKHESGKRLGDFADVTLDNGAPYGDALLALPDGTTACAVSSMSAALLVQMVVAETVARFEAAGEEPPVYVSTNVPGGFERNLELERPLAGRIRRNAN